MKEKQRFYLKTGKNNKEIPSLRGFVFIEKYVNIEYFINKITVKLCNVWYELILYKIPSTAIDLECRV